MTDLIERLRESQKGYKNLSTITVWDAELCHEAADEIERLRAELSTLAEGNVERWERECADAAEIKRLRAELRLRNLEYIERQEWAAEQAMAVIKEKDAEIERLRAVLEQIRDLRPGYKFPDPRDIAYEALRDE